MSSGFGDPGIVAVTAISAGALIGLIGEETLKAGPESKRALARVRSAVLNEFKQDRVFHLIPEADLNAADDALARSLADCVLNRSRLAESAVHVDGFPRNAAAIIVEELARHDPVFSTPSPDTPSNQTCRQFARKVIEIALSAALDDRDYFTHFEPHLLISIAQGIGTLQSGVENINSKLDVVVKALHPRHTTETNNEPRPLSAILKRKKKLAVTASRKHNISAALRLWKQVQKQAQLESDKVEAIVARLEMVRAIAVADDGRLTGALKLTDECLRDSEGIDLGRERCRLLQIAGEVHRLSGDEDRARGFILAGLKHAQEIESRADEGFALLALSFLEVGNKKGHNQKASELVERAYNAFSAHYAKGDTESQRLAREGFAQCHCCRAEILDFAQPDEALSEWARAIEILSALGKDQKWELADTFLRRAKLHTRLHEFVPAFKDINDADQIFRDLKDTVGGAKCFLEGGALFDEIGRREEAAPLYRQAAAIAATWKDERRASYFYFRHACKLVELRNYNDAERIFTYLFDSEWLEPELKLTVISQLCLVSQANGNDELLKTRRASALSLIDELIRVADSPEERRGLMMKKGQHLEQFGKLEDAHQTFTKAMARFEASGDKQGVIECWFQIRGLMHRLDDKAREREAAEMVLSLGAEKTAPILAGLTLVTLAQLNIHEGRLEEARRQLDRAEEIGKEPMNPAVFLIAKDLRTKLAPEKEHEI